MKSSVVLAVTICFVWIVSSCKGKEKEVEKEPFISAVSIINGQIQDVDTSMYVIIKVTYRDSITRDTEYIPREDFRLVAKDFLDLPELSRKNYVEENIPGPADGLSTISYKPIDPGKEEIQRLDFIIDPALAEIGKNVIKTVFIDRGFSNKDSSVEKKLLWRMDKSFQVTIMRQYAGKPETTTTFSVIWNDEEDQ